MADKNLIPAGISGKNTIVINDLIDRLMNLDLQSINIYDIDNVDKLIFPYLTYQFHITNREGWYLSRTESERRSFIKELFELHKYKGTKYAIKKILKKIGINSDIDEWYESGECERGEFFVNINLSETPITDRDKNIIIELIDEYKNVRSHLKDIRIQSFTRNRVGVLQMQEVTASAKMENTISYETKDIQEIITSSQQTITAFAEME